MRETAKGVDGRFLQESYKSLKSRQRIFSAGENTQKMGRICPRPLAGYQFLHRLAVVAVAFFEKP
jgi:hypothetical protein